MEAGAHRGVEGDEVGVEGDKVGVEGDEVGVEGCGDAGAQSCTPRQQVCSFLDSLLSFKIDCSGKTRLVPHVPSSS